MFACKLVNTPLPPNEKLSAHEGQTLADVDTTNYRSVVGTLQ